MVIYKTINLLNNKFYIGKDEKNNPKYLGSGKILKLAISKYGIENFKKEILEVCSTKQQLEEQEKFWINHLSATTLGYNITEGGTGGQTKFKTVYQFNKDGSFIKEWISASEVKRTLNFDDSSILKVCKRQLLSFKGFIWSYEKNVKPYEDPRQVKTLQYDKKGYFIKEWGSVVEVQKYFGISDRQIQQTLDKSNLTAKGFIWLRRKGIIENKINITKSGNFGNKNAAKNKNK